MLNREKHRLILGRVIGEIYRDANIAPLLGFKGGTAANLFYGLPRFSVDLDFDLLKEGNADLNLAILEKIKKITGQFGEISESYVKRFTIFLLLSYGKEDHNIKIEINTRALIFDISDKYEFKENLGISMMVAKPGYMFASKLAALTGRKIIAPRDIFDINYFAKNNWDIDKETLLAITGKTFKKQLSDCVFAIEELRDNQIMRGMGELIDEKQKNWVRLNLRQETVLLLKNYLAALE